MWVVCQDVLHKLTALHLLCILLALRQMALVVQSLSRAAEKSEDDDFGVSDDSGDVKERRFANCHSLILHKSK